MCGKEQGAGIGQRQGHGREGMAAAWAARSRHRAPAIDVTNRCARHPRSGGSPIRLATPGRSLPRSIPATNTTVPTVAIHSSTQGDGARQLGRFFSISHEVVLYCHLASSDQEDTVSINRRPDNLWCAGIDHRQVKSGESVPPWSLGTGSPRKEPAVPPEETAGV